MFAGWTDRILIFHRLSLFSVMRCRTNLPSNSSSPSDRAIKADPAAIVADDGLISHNVTTPTATASSSAIFAW
jgi:hypothetical protein